MKVVFERFQSLLNENGKNCRKPLEEYGDWHCVKTEKIHGANFSFYANSERYWFASRNGVLGPEANFFQFQRFFTEEKIKHILSNLDLSPNSTYRFIGELFGGHDSPVKPVQRDIKYDGDIQFRVFAIEVIEPNRTLKLPWDAVLRLCGDWLPTVPVIAEGKLRDLYPVEIEVPSVLCSNKDIAEGFCYRVDSHDLEAGYIIFKRRTSNFAEVKVGKGSITEKVMNPKILSIMVDVDSYITEQRVSNVNSHFGFDSMKDFAQLHKAVMDDVFKDAKAELGLTDDDCQLIKKDVGYRLVPLIKIELNK